MVVFSKSLAMATKKYLIPIFTLLFGLLIGVTIANSLKFNYLLPTNIAGLLKFNPTPSPIVSPSPTPEIEPSERALKIASFAMVRVSESKKKELKQRYSVVSMSDTDFIRFWALEMDKDSALLAKNEALMEKTIARENQPVVNVEPPQVNVESQDYPKHCTSSKIGQFTYTDCY